MAKFKRKEGEKFESFLRRFNKGLQRSGRLREARDKRYLQNKRNKRKRKENALFGIELNKKREYFKKIGKLKDGEDIKKK